MEERNTFESFFAAIGNMTLGDVGSWASIFGAIETLVFLLVSILAWIYRKAIGAMARKIIGSAPWLFPIPPKVFGRGEQIKGLHKALNRSGAAAVTAVHGMGGVGKSTLAAEYARLYRKSYHGGVWVNAQTSGGVLNDLTKLAAVMGVEVPTDGTPLPPAVVQALLFNLPKQKKPWLIIFDNVDTPTSMADYMPNQDHIKIIQTSRETMGWGDIETIPTEVLDVTTPDSDGVELLMHHAKRDGDAAAAHRLAQALGGLCLALEHAGKLIAEEKLTYASYLEGYTTRLNDLPASISKDDKTVAASIMMSVEKVNETERDVLALLAWMAEDGLRPELIADGFAKLVDMAEGDAPDLPDLPEIRRAFPRLTNLSLLTSKSDTWSMHRITSDVIRAAFGTEAAEMAARALAAQVGDLDPNISANWPKIKPLAPHVMALGRKNAEAEDTALALAFNRVGIYLGKIGDTVGHMQAAQMERDVQSRVHGEDSLGYIIGLAAHGVAKMGAGDFAGAEADLRRAVEWARQHHDGTADLADWIMNLAYCLYEKDNRQNRAALDEARDLMDQALVLRTALFGVPSAPVAHVHSELSVVWDALGDLPQAAHHSRIARDMRRTLLDATDADLATSEMNAGSYELRQGQWAAALDSLQRAFDIRAHVFQDHPQNDEWRLAADWLITAHLAGHHAGAAHAAVGDAGDLAAQFGFDWPEREFKGHTYYLEALHRQGDTAGIAAHLKRYPEAEGALIAVIVEELRHKDPEQYAELMAKVEKTAG